MEMIDLTHDDDVVSTGHQEQVGSHQAIADAKFKEAQRRQNEREANKHKRKLQNLEELKSGREVLELSDEEPVMRQRSTLQRSTTSNLSTRVTPNKTSTSFGSTLVESPAKNAKPERLSAHRTTGTSAQSTPAIKNVSRSIISTPHRSNTLQSEKRMESPTTNNTTAGKSNAFQPEDPGARALDRSPALKSPTTERKENRSSANKNLLAHAGDNHTSHTRRILTSHTDAEQNILPTPALTPASLTDNLDDVEEYAQESNIVRLHVDDIHRALKRTITALREYQENLVIHRLEDAEKLYLNFPGPQKNPSTVIPFRNLFQKRTRAQDLVMQMSIVSATGSSKPTTVSVEASSFSANTEEVPKVKSIGRLGASRDLLTRNVRKLNHMPWFEDNEADPDFQQEVKGYAHAAVREQETQRYEDIEREYKIDIEKLSRQRRCRAFSDVWRPHVLNLFTELGLEVQDVLYYLLHKDEREQPAAGMLSPKMHEVWMERTETCPSCSVEGSDCRGPEGRRITSFIKRPLTERRLAMAGLLCAVFVKATKFNLWHIVAETRITKELQQHYLEQKNRADHPSTNILATFCYVCCEFKCLTHGSYIHEESVGDSSQGSSEQDMPSSQDRKEAFLDDPELRMNTRVYAALPIRENTTQHPCGVFCVEAPIAEMLGLRPNSTISGVARLELQDLDPPTFDDTTLCPSKECFWDVSRRTEARLETISQEAKTRSLLADKKGLFRTLLPMELTSRRGPCELAMAYPDATCLEIFYLMLCYLHTSAHSETPDIASTPEIDVDLSNDIALQLRNSFIPCSHAGPCQLGICSCADEKVSCEPSCGCRGGQCPRRFKGCTCRDQRRQVCFDDSRCECWMNNRECYPELCVGCGVREVLDSVNKGREDQDLHSSCRNNRIQLGISKRTIMGVSEVHGWGLYAGEAIAKSDFISEYKGELISVEEGNRRGSVYHTLGCEYLFKLNKDQELDGSRISNKARFINNSSLSKNINVIPRLMLCNGLSRIMLYAARDIIAGEELFYDYGYHKEQRAKFKEKPDPTKRPPLTSNSGSQITPSQVSSTASSVRSEQVLPVREDALDEAEDETVLPRSEHGSEFDLLEQAASSDSEAGDSIPSSSSIPPEPSGQSGPGSKSDRNTDLFFSLLHHPDEAPRKRMRLSQPKPPDSDSHGAVAPSHGIVSGTADESEQPTRTRKLTRVASSERKRKIHPGDKRFGGAVQRKAAQVRKRRLAEQEALGLVSATTPRGRKRKREKERASSPAHEPTSSQPTKARWKLLGPKQLASEAPSTEPGPSGKQLPDSDFEEEDEGVESSSLSESSSCSASPPEEVKPNTSKRVAPSDFGTEGTRLIPRGSPAQSSHSKSRQSDLHLLGYAPR